MTAQCPTSNYSYYTTSVNRVQVYAKRVPDCAKPVKGFKRASSDFERDQGGDPRADDDDPVSIATTNHRFVVAILDHGRS